MTAEMDLTPDQSPEAAGLPTVLFVDDEVPILKAMTRFSRGKAWHVLVAQSGEEGLAVMAQHPVDLVVSDMRMPGLAGDVFLAKVKALYPQTLRILLTGQADIQCLENAINEAGIYNYIQKPWDDHLLHEVIRGGLRLQFAERERVRLEALTKKQNRQLGRLALSLDKTVKERTIETEQALTLLQMTHEKSKSSLQGALGVVAHLLEWNECRASNHSRFVADYAQRLAQALGMPEDDIDLAKMAGLLHDIGLMALPEAIRRKPVCDLTDAELSHYQQHPLLGEMTLSAAQGLERVAKVVRLHHERLDGTGFPEGLYAKSIDRISRIVGLVADYHDLHHGFLIPNCLGHDAAKRYVLKQRGFAYDPDMVDLFFKILGDQRAHKIERFKARVSELVPGMCLEDNLKINEMTLLTRGAVITQPIIERLANYERKMNMQFEIMVRDVESVSEKGVAKP
jgi:adenylate cyclase